MNEEIKFLKKEFQELRAIVEKIEKKLTPTSRDILYARIDTLPKMDKEKLPI